MSHFWSLDKGGDNMVRKFVYTLLVEALPPVVPDLLFSRAQTKDVFLCKHAAEFTQTLSTCVFFLHTASQANPNSASVADI